MPTGAGEEVPVFGFLGTDIRGELEPGRHPSGQLQDAEEARALVALDHLAAQHRPGIAPPLGHRRVARGLNRGLLRPRRQMDGGPHSLPGHIAERHGAIGGTQIPAYGQIRVMTANAQIDVAGPELELAGVDVEQRRPGEPTPQARGNAIAQVEQEAVARAGP